MTDRERLSEVEGRTAEPCETAEWRGRRILDIKEPPIEAILPPWLVRDLKLGRRGGETPDLSALPGRAFVDAKEPPIGAPFSAVALAALGLRHRVPASEGK